MRGTTAENRPPGTLRTCKFLGEVQNIFVVRPAARGSALTRCREAAEGAFGCHAMRQEILRAEIAPHPYMYYMSRTCICLQLVQLCLTYKCTSVVSALLPYLQVHFCLTYKSTNALLSYLQMHFHLNYKYTSVLPTSYRLQVHFCVSVLRTR